MNKIWILSCRIQLFYEIQTSVCLHFHRVSLYKSLYLCKDQCWWPDPDRCPAGNYGSALYVPPEKYAACSSAHSSYTCVVCQLRHLRERITGSFTATQKERVSSVQ